MAVSAATQGAGAAGGADSSGTADMAAQFKEIQAQQNANTTQVTKLQSENSMQNDWNGAKKKASSQTST